MAEISSILSILVNADTSNATSKLTQFDRQFEATRSRTREALRAHLGGEFNQEAFNRYDARLTQTQRKIADRAKFKAALGGDFNPAAFTAYERAIDKARATTAAADATTRRFASTTTHADVAARRLSTGISSVGGRLAGFASNFATVGFAVGAAGAASVKAGLDFQRSMTMILGVAGTTQRQVDALSKSVLSLAGSTATAPDELAKGLFHLTAQGIHGARSMEALGIAAKGAKIGQANLEDVTNALGAAIASQVKGTSNLENAMQSMITTVKTGDMTMQQLAEAYGTGLLGPMKQFGVNLQDINAALAVFGDNNIRGADAGTKLGSAIRIMAAPSKQASKELATIGLSATGLADTLRSGPGGLLKAMEELKSHLEAAGLTASQQARVLALAFGGRQATGVQLLIGQLDRLKSKEGEISGGAGQFSSQWDATKRTFKVQVDQLVADLQRIGIQLAVALEPAIPVLVRMAGHVSDFVTQMMTGKGAGGQFASALKTAFGIVKTAATGVYDALGGIKGTIEAIAFGYAASKLLKIAGAFRSLGGGLRAVSGSGVARATGAAASSEVAAAGGVGGVRGVAGRLSSGLGRVLGAAGWLALAAPLGIALTNVVGKWISGNANREGDEWASRFTQHLGGHISAQVRDGLAKATNTAIRTPRPGSQQAQAEAGNTHLILNPGQRPNPQLFNQAFNKQFDQLYTAVKMAGQKAGETFIAAWGSVKFPTESLLIASIDRALNSVPQRITRQGPQWVQLWKDQAAQQMLQYATKLNQEGKLPLSAVQNLMRRLEGQIPGFSAYLQSQGLMSDQAFAKALKFTQATATLKQTLSGYRKDFNDTSISINLTGGNINSNVARAMKHLKSIISTSTGDARAAAVHDFNRLKDQTTSTFGAMADRVSQTSADMSGSIQQGSKRARTVAVDNFARFQAAVYDAMSSGSLSTSTGMSLITRSLNATLKALGVKQIPVTTIDPHLPKSAIQKSVGGAARGGLFQIGRQGEGGRDSVPLNVGGTPIMVAPGEQVAVFNRHQLPVVNQALAPMGGLPGLFSKVSRPNYMAGGGMVGGGGGISRMIGTANAINSEHFPYVWGGGHNAGFTGPYDCSGAVSAVLHSAGLLNAPEVSGQLMSYGLPGPGAVTIYANPVHAFMSIDGRFFGTHGASGAGWYAGAPRPGFAVRHAPVGAGGEIAAPAIKGGGTISRVVRAAVGKGAHAANALLSKTFSKMVAGGGAGGGDWGTFGAGRGVEGQLARVLSAQGFNKTAVAGILGNVAQESNYGASSPNLFQFTPPIPGSSGSVAQQVALMMSHGGAGLLGRLNSAGSPAAAAALFMNLFEKPAGWAANLPNRQAQAQSAFAAGYGRGGKVNIAGAFAAGGLVPHSRASSTIHAYKAKAPHPTTHKVKTSKAHAGLQPPHLRVPAVFDQAIGGGVTALTNIDTTVGELDRWQGFIQSLHGRVPVTPTLTDANGNELINWGGKDAAINMLTGMRDPSTGQATKGIFDRLREIGAATDRVNPTAGKLADTELGLDYTLLGQYLQQRSIARTIGRKFRPWLSREETIQQETQALSDWLTAAVDPYKPFDDLPKIDFESLGKHKVRGKSVGWAKTLLEKAREYKNALAAVEYLRNKKGYVGEDRRHREEQISIAFAKRKQAISSASARQTYDSSAILHHSVMALTDAEAAAKQALPDPPPKGWKGDRKAWSKQHQSDLAQISEEFASRRNAVEGSIGSRRFAQQMKRTGALAALNVEEIIAKGAAQDHFAAVTRGFDNSIAAATKTGHIDKDFLGGFLKTTNRDLGNVNAAIKSVTDTTSGTSLDQQLRAYLDPTGDLAINIATKRNIDIPALVSEAQALGATHMVALGASALDATGASSSTVDTQALQQQLQLTQQIATQAQQTAAVSQAQYQVLSSLPPFGGSFASGGMVPGPAGVPRTIIAHGGEMVSNSTAAPEVHLHFADGMGWLRDFVRVEINQSGRGDSRYAVRALPGARGR